MDGLEPLCALLRARKRGEWGECQHGAVMAAGGECKYGPSLGENQSFRPERGAE